MTAPCSFQSAGYNQLTKGRDGYFLVNENDTYIGRSLLKYGEYSPFEMHLFKQLCGAGHIVIEVGANIGSHTVGLARLVGRGGRVLAFEPQRLVFQTLCANVALNSLDNVDCYWSAVGSEQSDILVPELPPDLPNNFGALGLGAAKAGIPVPCIRLDRHLDLPRLDLLKIDVEGMESEVIRGGAALISKFKPVILVENDRIEKSRPLIELIASLGYRLYWHLPPLFDPDNFRKDPENIFPDVVSCNMLCIHKEIDRAVAGISEVLDPSYHPIK